MHSDSVLGRAESRAIAGAARLTNRSIGFVRGHASQALDRAQEYLARVEAEHDFEAQGAARTRAAALVATSGDIYDLGPSWTLSSERRAALGLMPPVHT